MSEILLFVATWMNLECLNQIEKDIYTPKNTSTQIQRIDGYQLQVGFRMGEMEKVGQEGVMYSIVTIVNVCVAYLKVPKRVDLQSFIKRKKYNCVMTDVYQTYCVDHFANIEL